MRSSRPRVLLVALLWALAAATASAQSAYYLRRGGLFALDPPPAGATAAVLSVSLPAGGAALVGSFASAPLDAAVVADAIDAALYLGTGKSGMDGCAELSVTLTRLAGATSTAVAAGDLATSIGPRHQITAPILVPLALAQPLIAAAGDRVVLAVRVTNHCNEARTVSLLYDAATRASRVDVTAAVATSTTTTTLSGATTTSTTAIAPSCLETATGLAAVRCRLERIDEILRGASPADLGGVRYASRLARRIHRAAALVRAPELVEPTPRRLRRADRQLLRFGKAVARGRVAADLAAPLATLAAEAATTLASLTTS